MKKRNVLDQEAVSPVIATILMVAITVVLAATLYMMIDPNDTGSSPEAMSAGVETKTDGWLVEINAGSTIFLEDDIQLYNSTSGVAETYDTEVTVDEVYVFENLSQNDVTLNVTFNDNDGNGDINGDDSFRLTITSTDGSGNDHTPSDLEDNWEFRIAKTSLQLELKA